MNTLSWKNATTPLPMEINPRVVFERLFGGGTTRESRMARIKTDRSLLDFVAGDLKQLEASIGGRDKARLEDTPITCARSSAACSWPSAAPIR